MSDRSKRLADDARIRARFAETAAKPAWQPPKCACGTTAVIAASDRRDHLLFYCLRCAPPEALDAFMHGPLSQ